jgi:monofunctional biosynthetic peptidoglycan transglycosylase
VKQAAGRALAGTGRVIGRGLLLVIVCFIALQLWFAARVALMAVVDPASTSVQRSEAWRLLRRDGRILWSQQWRDHDRIATTLKRAVIASEDAGFREHSGIEWDAIERAWERNQRAEAVAQRQAQRQARAALRADLAPPPVKVVGGSTITQQLAKNLLLSGERHLLRKAQEAVLTVWLEAFLGKRRILELYLNHVEWGEGVFGAQAAARHHFRVDADRLGPMEAARLAVMLPAPKRFEKRPQSAYLAGRSATIAARMGAVNPP